MYTLGIETSCDETSCAVLHSTSVKLSTASAAGGSPLSEPKVKHELLSNVISSSLFRHQPFGGVVPEIASRHCLEQIDLVLEEALDQAKVRLKDIHLIAVTYGPGLIGSLFIGVSFAKALSYQLNIPLIGVNHLEAHLAANFIGVEEPPKYIGLLVSGGHTLLSYHEKAGAYPPAGEAGCNTPLLLGQTVDDAVGEAFDKVAKLLGLGYPGGPIIERLAQEGNPKAFPFTKPKQDKRFDFSFSGIKTAVRYLIEDLMAAGGMFPEAAVGARHPPAGEAGAVPLLSDQTIRDIAASFQENVVQWLVEKALDAAEVKGAEAVVVGGGVSANQYLKKMFAGKVEGKGIRIYFPPRILSLDNAGMIARRGWELFQKGERSSLHLTAAPNLPMK